MQLTFKRLVIAVLTIWIVAPIVVIRVLPEWPERGQFGDIFGSVNALFSGLAFVGLFWALRVQQSQLELQRDELKLQREELKLQREEMVASRRELTRQVEVQEALFRATAAQVTVASVQAKIEAIKLDAQERNPGGRSTQINEIKSLAESLTGLSEWVERGSGKSAA